jgi:hypothetical protein
MSGAARIVIYPSDFEAYAIQCCEDLIDSIGCLAILRVHSVQSKICDSHLYAYHKRKVLGDVFVVSCKNL